MANTNKQGESNATPLSEDWEVRIDSLQTRIGLLIQKLVDKSFFILDQALPMMPPQNESLAQIQQRVTSQAQELVHLSAALSKQRMEAAVQTAQTDIHALKKKCEELEQKLQATETQLQGLTKLKEDLEVRAAGDALTASAKETDYISTITRLRHREAVHVNNKQELEVALRKMREEQEKLEGLLAEGEIEQKDLKAQIKDGEAERNRLETQVDSIRAKLPLSERSRKVQGPLSGNGNFALSVLSKVGCTDWLVGRTLGVGSLGVAHVIEHRVSGKLLALKTFSMYRLRKDPVDFDATEKQTALYAFNDFHREYEWLASDELRHENILRAHFFFQCTPQLKASFTTELMEGDVRSLWQGQFKNYDPFHEAWAFEIFKQGMTALAHLEKMNLCHRDIKPDNLLYRFEPTSRLHIKLADFGCAAVQGNIEQPYHGRPGWRSPEVHNDNRSFSPKSDVFVLFLVVLTVLDVDGHYTQLRKDKKDVDANEIIKHAENVWQRDARFWWWQEVARRDPQARMSASKVLHRIAAMGNGLTVFTTPTILRNAEAWIQMRKERPDVPLLEQTPADNRKRSAENDQGLAGPRALNARFEDLPLAAAAERRFPTVGFNGHFPLPPI